jgi:hypothetical protein
VDVAGAGIADGNADGNAVQLYICNGTAAQAWTVASGTIRALGKCLDVTAGSTDNGAKGSAVYL